MQFNPAFAYLPLKPGTKLPITLNGVKDACKPGSPIFQQWEKNKYTDWAVACGEASGLIVVDIDVKSGGLDTLTRLETEHEIDILHYTYTVKTQSGGYHLYFKLEPGQEWIRNKVNFAPGWDLRASNGYVKVYPTLVNDEIPQPLPDLIIELIKQSERKTSQALRNESANGVVEGGRNAYLTAVAGRLQRSDILTYDALDSINERDCNPPLDEREVEVIFNSVSRYLPENPVSQEGFEEVYNRIIGKNKTQQGSLVVKASDLSNQMCEYLNDKELVRGGATGIVGLNDLLGGGFRLGEVVAWHAEAKVGKNTLWHKLMHSWLSRQNPIPIGYASRELTPETEVLPDLLSIEYQKNVRLVNVKESEYQHSLAKWPLYFASGYGHFPFEDIIKWVLELKNQGIQYFWFDHLHYMLEDPEEYKEASKLIKNIKSLAKSENINIQIIIQPNKLMEGQKLSLNSIKGGSALGQAIDTLITLERVQCETPNIMMLQVKAARSKLSKIGKIYLQYNPQTIDMIEVEPEEALKDSGPRHED